MKTFLPLLICTTGLGLMTAFADGGNGSAGQGTNGHIPSIWEQQNLTGDWDGFRTEMGNHGVTLTPVWQGEVFGNPSGGMKQGVISDGLFNIALDLDLERITGGSVDGLLIHANALYTYGPSLSGFYVGDFSNTSSIAAYNTLRLQELWLQKSFFEKRLSLKIGEMAVDNEFFQSSSAALFLNGTFGAFTLIGNNVPDAPVYPIASPGVRIQLVPIPQFYVMAGVYEMDNDFDPEINTTGITRFAIGSATSMLIMSEVGYLINQAPNDKGLQGSTALALFCTPPITIPGSPRRILPTGRGLCKAPGWMTEFTGSWTSRFMRMTRKPSAFSFAVAARPPTSTLSITTWREDLIFPGSFPVIPMTWRESRSPVLT